LDVASNVANNHSNPNNDNSININNNKDDDDEGDDDNKDNGIWYYDDEYDGGKYLIRCKCLNHVDDGSEMIMCGDCEAWQHISCVLTAAIEHDKDFICERCITKKGSSGNSLSRKRN